MTGTRRFRPTALSHDGKPGLVRTGQTAGAPTRVLNFTAKGGNALPPNSSVTWKGTLTLRKPAPTGSICRPWAPTPASIVDGKRLGVTGAFQGGVHGDILQANQDNAIPTTDGLDNVRRAVELTAGPHAIEVKTSPDTSNAPVQVRLNWYTPEQRKADHEAAIAAAKNAKVAVVFVWTRPPAGLRPARRSGQAGRRNRRRQSQHHRRAQHQPAGRAAVGGQGEGDPGNVVARR